MLDKSTKKKEDRMCKIAIMNAVMKQDDIARVLNVSESAVSRHLKGHRESGSITKRKRSTLIHTGQCKRTGGCYNELVVAFYSTGGGVKGKKIYTC